MPEPTWEERWDARVAEMEAVFGPCDDKVLHGTIPFELGLDIGGAPDIITFSNFLDGRLYVTAELIGSEQKPNSRGNYELAIAHRGEEDWGVPIMCKLAHYTMDTVIEDGETIDIASAIPSGSSIEALLFRRIAEFSVLGVPANVLCCIGISGAELDFCKESGSKALIERFGANSLITDLHRESVV